MTTNSSAREASWSGARASAVRFGAGRKGFQGVAAYRVGPGPRPRDRQRREARCQAGDGREARGALRIKIKKVA